MIVQGFCAACGMEVTHKYNASSRPRLQYCDMTCVRLGPAVWFDHDADTCVVVVPGCERRGNDAIGVGHGYSAYAAGCRCTICRHANRKACAAARWSKYADRCAGVPLGVEHGLSGYQNHGCRCEVCRLAKKIDNAVRRGSLDRLCRKIANLAP